MSYLHGFHLEGEKNSCVCAPEVSLIRAISWLPSCTELGGAGWEVRTGLCCGLGCVPDPVTAQQRGPQRAGIAWKRVCAPERGQPQSRQLQLGRRGGLGARKMNGKTEEKEISCVLGLEMLGFAW